MSAPYQAELDVAVQSATAAGALIRDGFYGAKAVEDKKNTSDLVTQTDVKSEEIVFSRIRSAFPDHLLIGEESSAEGGVTNELTDAPTWMCDPLDGTTNFVHSYPNVCVSIALSVKKEVVVGVVYNPIMDELFCARKGCGATLNGKPIHASNTQDLNRALLATEMGVTRDAATFHAIFARITTLAQAMQSIRCTGSCALNLCSVAVGRIDAFYEIGFGGCWDVAAGALIVLEAGGAISDPAGGPFGLMSRRVLAGAPAVVPKVAALLATCPTSNNEPAPPS